MGVPSLQSMKRFVQSWNIKYPIDHWWRVKHKVPFNSSRHRSMNFIDMKLEFIEDVLYIDLRKKEELSDRYSPGAGTWLKRRRVKRMSQDDIDQAFAELDLRQINKTDDGRIMI